MEQSIFQTRSPQGGNFIWYTKFTFTQGIEKPRLTGQGSVVSSSKPRTDLAVIFTSY